MAGSTIPNAPSGQKTTLVGTEKFPISGSQYALVSAIGTYLRTPTFSDTAPSSPTADDLWWETDTNIMWTYGTFAAASRWVSANLYNTGSAFTGVAASTMANIFYPLSGTDYDLYLDTYYMKWIVQTTNSGSAYWTVNLRKVSGSTIPAAGAGTQLATLTTSAGSPDAWTINSVSVNAILDNAGAGSEQAFLDLVKTSTPGNFSGSLNVTYRLVHP